MEINADWTRSPHRRFNPLLGRWILVSPQRTERPWQGAVEKTHEVPPLAWDPGCYLCPRNQRARGVRNPDYTSTFVFDNDFPALLPGAPHRHIDHGGLISAVAEQGICRVACFSPRHDLTVSRMNPEEVRTVVEMWRSQYLELGALPFIQHVQIFENRGELMGASNPHPHCQIWANATMPDDVAVETASQLEYSRRKSSCLLCDYLTLENAGERIVCENESFVALVPYWAVWPFETMLLPRRHRGSLAGLNSQELADLAAMVRTITAGYDTLFQTMAPYSMGLHQEPTDGKKRHAWHMHVHFFPPLLRPGVRKFMVGYEMLAGAQRDITAETAAERIRSALFGSGT